MDALSSKGVSPIALQAIANSRKFYKMTKGSTEAVWPPDLEKAMLTGLASYRPSNCRETKLLGRFPMRNIYVSNFICHTTGKRRSPKQVGSRLQQIRDSLEGRMLLRSLSQNPGKEPWPHNSSENMSSARAYSDPNSSTLLPTSSVSLGSTYPTSTPLDATPNRHTFVYIEILPNGSPTPCTTSTFMCNMSGVNEQASKPALFSNGITDVFRPSCHPRPICSINPTITLLSRSEISAKSYCLAVLDGVPVYEESTELDIASSESCADAKSALLYSVKLLPGYWETICLCPDPTRYKIIQRITRRSTEPMAEEHSLIFSAVYHLSYPAEAGMSLTSSSSCSVPITTHSPTYCAPDPSDTSAGIEDSPSAALQEGSHLKGGLWSESSSFDLDSYNVGVDYPFSKYASTSSCFPSTLSSYL